MSDVALARDPNKIVTSYAAEMDDGRVFLIHNFADEDFYMVMKDDDGITRIGRFDSLEAAQSHALKLMDRPHDA